MKKPRFFRRTPEMDGPYPQENMVTDPRTGEPVPALQLLDEVHLQVRADELIRQSEQPEKPREVLGKVALQEAAQNLTRNLTAALTDWEPRRISDPDPETSTTVVSYVRQHNVGGRLQSYEAQVFRNADETVYGGNVTIYRSDGGWPREYFAYFATGEGPDKRLTVYSTDHPYHEEDLGTIDKNTTTALATAQQMVVDLAAQQPPENAN